MVCVLRPRTDGSCETCMLEVGSDGMFVDGERMHVHFEEYGLLVLSSRLVECLKDYVNLFEYPLPPPLNMYLYPDNIILARRTQSRVTSLTLEELVAHCQQFKNQISETQNKLAIYDVPLDETTYVHEDESEEEDEEYHDFECEDDQELEDDDWDVEDDDVPVAN